jgi:hypothetical protein
VLASLPDHDMLVASKNFKDIHWMRYQMQKKYTARFINIITTILLVILSMTLATTRAYGQQSGTTIKLMQTVTGVINETQTEQRWTISVGKGQRLGLRMKATAGDLDPYIELLDKDGNVIIKGNPSSLRNSTIDAFVVPDTNTYTIRATRSADKATTTGTYSLSATPGFSFLLLNDPSGTNAPMRTWQNPNSFSHFANNSLEMQLTADNSYTWTTVADRFGTFKNLYLQADVTSANPDPKSYWEAGLMLRGVRMADALQFYVFFVNSDGKWKLSLSQPGLLKDLSDWKVLPVTVQKTATLGLMVQENKLSVFYNGQLLTEVEDKSVMDEGTFGVAIGTGTGDNNNALVRFSNFVVTLPAGESATEPIKAPTQLAEWQRAQEPMLAELLKYKLIPSIGKMGLEIKTKAFVTNNTGGGIVMQPLAESLTFTDIVYSADVTWESSNENTACAMELRAADDSNFTIIYLDRNGGYGVRQESKTKEAKESTVNVSLYNLSNAILKDNLATNRVTIVAVGNSLMVYVNGVLLADLTVKQSSGGVRIAAYNYQRASSICQFTNLWLRSFDQ